MSSIKEALDKIKERAKQTKEGVIGIKKSLEDSIESFKLMPAKRLVKRVRKRLKEIRFRE